ncbi:MAG: glycosyltransferase family 2 protein [Pseudomonadota bacterium]
MKVTVVMPTCGRPLAPREAIRSLLACDLPRRGVEVVVVDNNSDEAMSSALRAICESAGDPVRYVAEPSPGQSAARHRGAIEAHGEVLIYVDDDVQVSPAWIDAFLNAFEDGSVGLAGGPSIPVFSGSIPPWFWDFIQPTPYGGWMCGWLSLLDIGKTVDGVDPIWIWGLNFAIRRELLFKLGGFHPDLVPASMQRWQGDGETGLAFKATTSGVRCVYLQDALLHHVIGADRMTPEAFAKRAYYQGICNSFTRIRAGDVPSATPQGPKAYSPNPDELQGWAKVAHEVRAATIAAHNDGWCFHQREAALDPELLAWIRRDDFWNSDIREEVQRRATRSGDAQ